MEEQQNKNNPVTGGNNKANEEKELLKEARILVRDQKGEFEYLKGASLFGKEAPSYPPPPEKRKEVKQVTASQVRPSLRELKKPLEKVKAGFYFDAEDEEEVQKIHDKKIGEAAPIINYENIVEEIKQEAGVSLPDESLQKRFSSLVISRLRDIRTSIQLKELLTRSKKIGGLELPEEKADKVISITEEKAKSIHNHKTIEELEEREKKKQEEEKKEAAEQAKVRQAVAREQIRKAVQAMQKKAPAEEKPPPAPKAPPVPKEAPKVTSPFPIPRVQRPPQDIKKKPRIVDIKTPPRPLGPVEEIKSLNLTDFRRLATTPQEAVHKIKEKIELLEEESFTEKANGIQAWKQSEIYQLYLDIGNESMNKGKSVKEVIASRTMEGRSYLSEEEFEAVGDLNKELRF